MRNREPSPATSPGREAVSAVRRQAAQRAGARLTLGLLGALAVLAAAVPLGILVRSCNPIIVNADERISTAAETATASSQLLLGAARAVTLLGEPVLLTAVALLLAAVLAARGKTRLASFLLVARIGAVLLSTNLKHAVDRARPVFDEPITTALGASFPSGHALGSAAFYASVAVLLQPYVRRERLLLGSAVLISVLVALSRVLLGVHYPSDVTAGLLIGLGWAALCTAVFAAWRVNEGRHVDVVHEGIGTS